MGCGRRVGSHHLESSRQDRLGSPSHTRASSAPATAFQKALFLAIRGSHCRLGFQNRLFCKFSLITSDRDFLCQLLEHIMDSEEMLLSFTLWNSLLRLSVASGTSAVTGVTCSAISLTYLAASLTANLHVSEFSSISRSCFRRSPNVSHRLTLGVSIARSRYPSTSFLLADHQNRQDKRTRNALFTRAPPNNKDTRIQQRSATMFAVYLCPTRNTLFLTTVRGLCNTLM